MVIDLNEKEIKLIEMWYAGAASESYTEESDANFDLLDKLGIAADSQNLWPGNDWNASLAVPGRPAS